MRILVLDDEDVRHRFYRALYDGNDLTHVHTYHQFLDELTKGSPWDLIHLDHDLGDIHVTEDGTLQEYTGRHASLRICELDDALLPKSVVVHSFNTEGAKVMKSNLMLRGVSVEWKPFGSAQK
jgi:CheY-like chemotaxis protein